MKTVSVNKANPTVSTVQNLCELLILLQSSISTHPKSTLIEARCSLPSAIIQTTSIYNRNSPRCRLRAGPCRFRKTGAQSTDFGTVFIRRERNPIKVDTLNAVKLATQNRFAVATWFESRTECAIISITLWTIFGTTSCAKNVGCSESMD